jgi:hypothetical protein
LSSTAGFGAIITTYPDPPINLIEDYSKRSPTTLGFTWEPAAFTGGAVIIDYQILIAVSGETLQVLDSNLVSPQYTALGLTAGVIYDVAVQSRNSYNFSANSAVLTLLCAWKPEQPAAPSTYIVNDLLFVDWVEPVTNGW